jgi:hypothetical protein
LTRSGVSAERRNLDCRKVCGALPRRRYGGTVHGEGESQPVFQKTVLNTGRNQTGVCYGVASDVAVRIGYFCSTIRLGRRNVKTMKLGRFVTKSVFTLLALVLMTGCSTLNMFKGPDDYLRNFATENIKRGIDEAVQEEVRRDVPNGYKTQLYSRKAWNDYWNSRIYYLYDIGQTKEERAYRGPTGPEFIQYILQARRANGLPELQIEERNRDKIP